MYFWIRLIFYILTSWLRHSLEAPFGTSRLHYRAWPTDIDASLHMNNGRYNVLADIGRIDLMVRMGLAKYVMKQGYIPVLNFISTRYRREICLFDPFTVETKILSWDDVNIFIEHKFIITGGKNAGQAAALIVTKAGLYSRAKREYVTAQEIMQQMGLDVVPPPLSASVKALMEADSAFQQETVVEEQIEPQKLSA